MLRRVGGREKLAGGSAGAGVRTESIAEWRSRLGVMSSDYSDWILRVESGIEGEADQIQD